VSPGVTVLTTFSGVDHTSDGSAPKLFETRVFGGVLDSEETRTATKGDALAAHAVLAAWCRVGETPDFGITSADIAA
jgi:hypothetical protein